MMMTPTQMMMTVMVMTPRSRGGCSGLQARASLKLPQTSRQQQFVRFKHFDTIIIIIITVIVILLQNCFADSQPKYISSILGLAEK